MDAPQSGARLAGKKVVIIGGSSGIGKATARASMRAGAEVVIASRSGEHLREAENEIGGNVTSCVVDVRDVRTLDACFESQSPFDHLVITAVDVRPTRFLEVTPEDARQVFEVKFWGQFLAAQLSAPCIREEGSITLFSGVAGHKPVPGMSVVAAADGAVEALVRSLAVELRPIRVNAICPGFIDTHDMADARRDEVSVGLPAGRVGRPEEVAAAVMAMMENPFLTGSILVIDGGHHLV